MYKIIQSLNTFGGERLNPGFPTKRSMISFMKHSYEIHKEKDYVLYTDQYGADMLSFMSNSIEIFDFIEIDDRIPYIGKFQVQEIQNNPYIHVDLDAYINDVPGDIYNIVTEKLREPDFGIETKRINVDTNKIRNIICSGLIGFGDIEFKDLYIKTVFEKIQYIKNERNIGYKEFYTLEETTLSVLANQYKKHIHCLSEESFKHYYGNINKIIS